MNLSVSTKTIGTLVPTWPFPLYFWEAEWESRKWWCHLLFFFSWFLDPNENCGSTQSEALFTLSDHPNPHDMILLISWLLISGHPKVELMKKGLEPVPTLIQPTRWQVEEPEGAPSCYCSSWRWGHSSVDDVTWNIQSSKKSHCNSPCQSFSEGSGLWFIAQVISQESGANLTILKLTCSCLCRIEVGPKKKCIPRILQSGAEHLNFCRWTL